MTLERRLDKLETVYVRPAGCDICRTWHPRFTVIVGTDGPHRPETCPGCGRTVPIRSTFEVDFPLEAV